MTSQRIEGGLHRRERAEPVDTGLGPITGHVVVDQGPRVGFSFGVGGIVLRQVDHRQQRVGDRHGVFDVVAAQTGISIATAGREQKA